MNSKLTEKFVKSKPAPDPSGKQKLYWDADLRGFGLLCSGKTNSKTYIVQRDLKGGLTRRMTVGSVQELSLDAARKKGADILLDLRHGVDPKRQATTPTLREGLAMFLARKKRPLRGKSVVGYTRAVERYLAPWANRRLDTITRAMVEDMHASIAKSVADETDYAGLATANGAMRAFRAIYNFVSDRMADGLMPPNPVKVLKRQWYTLHRRTTSVKAEELPAFYAATMQLENEIARDYILLLLFTGLRRAEAAALRWDHVDFSSKTISIPAANTKANRKLDLPMTDYVHDLMVARRSIGKDAFVFPANSKSKHIEEPKFPLRLIGDASGIYISAHDLRRTYASVADVAGIPFLRLKALVNHALPSDVTSGYVQMEMESLRESAQRVCDKMKELCGVREPAGVRKLRSK